VRYLKLATIRPIILLGLFLISVLACAGEEEDQKRVAETLQAIRIVETRALNDTASLNAARDGCTVDQRQSHLVASVADHFRPGDLLYGLENEARVHVRKTLPASSLFPAVTIDKLNNLLVGLYAETPEELAANFKELFPEKTPTTARLELFAHYLFSHQILMKNDDESEFNFIRKACKAGISFTIEQGYQIHFVLDGLDMDRVVTRKKVTQRRTLQTRLKGATSNAQWVDDPSFTASELRYLHLLAREKPELLKQHVIFYREERTVPPPWESDPTLWSKPTSVENMND
jgi:hypothetical protein